MSFKQRHSLEKRREESARIRQKYSNRLPIVVEKAERSDIPEIDKQKFLVPQELTMGQFLYVIRKRIKLAPEQAIFLFVNNTLPPATALMSEIYKEHADCDGFLYVNYAGESVFGGNVSA